MDAFEDNTFGVPESDPAAEFLAREQDAMAGLDEDLAIPASESVTQQGLLLLLLFGWTLLFHQGCSAALGSASPCTQ